MLMQPTFNARSSLNKSLLVRLVRLIVGSTIKFPEVPTYEMSNDDLVSDVVVVSDGNRDYYAFWNSDFFSKKHLNQDPRDYVGAALICSVIEPDTGTRFDTSSMKIKSVDKPRGYAWIESAIRDNKTPSILSATSIVFDVNCSYRTAVELRGVVVDFPDPSRLVAQEIPDIPGQDMEAMRGFAEMSAEIATISPLCKDSDREIVGAALKEVHDVIRLAARSVSNPAVCEGLLPINSVVKCVVSKSVSEWRSWLIEWTWSVEAAWLKTQMFYYLKNALGPLFSDCDIVCQNQTELLKTLGLSHDS